MSFSAVVTADVVVKSSVDIVTQKQSRRKQSNPKKLSDRTKQWERISVTPLISIRPISQLEATIDAQMHDSDHKNESQSIDNKQTLFSMANILESQPNTIFKPIIDLKYRPSPSPKLERNSKSKRKSKQSLSARLRNRNRDSDMNNEQRSIYENGLISQCILVDCKEIIALQLRTYINIFDTTMNDLAQQLNVECDELNQLLSVDIADDNGSMQTSLFNNTQFRNRLIEWMRVNEINIPDCVLSTFDIDVFPNNCQLFSDSALIVWLRKYVNTQQWKLHSLSLEMHLSEERLSQLIKAKRKKQISLRRGERQKIVSWIDWRQRLLNIGGQISFLKQSNYSALDSRRATIKNENWYQSIKEGSFVNCVDLYESKWKSRILRRINNTVLIHYQNFSRVYDEWLNLGNDRITPFIITDKATLECQFDDNVKQILKEAMRDILQMKSIQIKDLSLFCDWKLSACQNWCANCNDPPKQKHKSLLRFVREMSALHGLRLDNFEDYAC